jgi:hypothetical protein
MKGPNMAIRNKWSIPNDIRNPDTQPARGLMEELTHILSDLQTRTHQQEILVTCRLNVSRTTGLSPFSVGWVESDALETRRVDSGFGVAKEPPPNFFGSTHLSPIYIQCLNNQGTVWARDYSDQRVIAIEKFVYPKALQYDVRLGLIYRRHVCIKAGKRRAGTLNVGFSVNFFLDPAMDTEIQNTLKEWAQQPSKTLVPYLEKYFDLGGPPVQDAKTKTPRGR